VSLSESDAAMAGKAKHAQLLSKHLNAPVDAACMINKTGAAKTMAIGGLVGTAAKAAMDKRKDGEELKVQTNGWLAVGPEEFTIVYGDKFLGRPKGDPIAQIVYSDVANVELSQGRITTRADVTLADGRAFAFETNRKGANKSNPEVLELLARRCSGRSAAVGAA
jgi:hypothetical protein